MVGSFVFFWVFGSTVMVHTFFFYRKPVEFYRNGFEIHLQISCRFYRKSVEKKSRVSAKNHEISENFDRLIVRKQVKSLSKTVQNHRKSKCKCQQSSKFSAARRCSHFYLIYTNRFRVGSGICRHPTFFSTDFLQNFPVESSTRNLQI